MFPAAAARAIGWTQTALIGAQEMDAQNGIPLCIRVLIHWNTDQPLSTIKHVYMHGAQRLRPDLYPDNKIIVEDKP
jgi:chorismate mutase